MHDLAWVGFWLAAGSLVYAYAGFPTLVGVVGWLRRREVNKKPITPSVSLIIAAYNEEESIGQRLRNALALDYPQEALEIIVASDGSTDRTEAIVEGFANPCVHLLRLPRRGKIPALNAAVAQAQGEILVFSDANSMCDSLALRKLTQNFADAEVGGVVGYTSYFIPPDSESSSRGEDLYWNYDSWLKQLESLSGNVVSAHGGLYAIRRGLYIPVSDPAVTDDFAISTAVIEQGRRLVFEREAQSFEMAVPKAGREFQRRTRLMTRGLRALLLRKRLLNPFRYGFYSLALFSHKVLRRLLAVALLIMFASSLALMLSGVLYAFAAAAQAILYSAAGAGYLLRRTRLGHRKCLYIPFFYCMANAAALVAVAKLMRGERIALWQPQRHSAGTP
jgi:cellulose synthase/poly-beta-1,6-N-acetylglucosamine synthase-like glycosyltransferase